MNLGQSIPYKQYSTLPRHGYAGNNYTVAAGLLIVTPDLEEVLLVKRKEETKYPGLWTTPGGFGKTNGPYNNEDPLNTAVRETTEELGAVPRGNLYITQFIYQQGNLHYHTFILQTLPSERTEFTRRLNHEVSDSKWFKIRNRGLLQRHLVPGVKESLDDLVRRSKQSNTSTN